MGEGTEEGMNKAVQAIALNLLGKGVEIATIAEVTGLKESVIKAWLTGKQQ